MTEKRGRGRPPGPKRQAELEIEREFQQTIGPLPEFLKGYGPSEVTQNLANLSERDWLAANGIEWGVYHETAREYFGLLDGGADIDWEDKRAVERYTKALRDAEAAYEAQAERVREGRRRAGQKASDQAADTRYAVLHAMDHIVKQYLREEISANQAALDILIEYEKTFPREKQPGLSTIRGWLKRLRQEGVAKGSR